MIANGCVLAFFVLLTVLSVKLVSDEFMYEETSPAIGVPTWWYSIWLPVMAAAISLRTLGIIRRILQSAGKP
ncbi:Tripartite ATP-independent periplasmic transporter, DctQ component [compost metagenome]